jgi:anthranilate phosphoribosyltransferase
MQIQDALRFLAGGGTLTPDQAETIFERLLTGALDDAQIAALLALMQARPPPGPTADELVGVARVMRRHVTPVRPSRRGIIVDTCGTGGAPKTFNISTAAAVIAAAAAPPGVGVAKHGNRSRSGRGSAEVLAELGVNVDATPEVQARCLDEVGVCFCFAIHHHPAMKYAAGPRRSLGFPTIFNLVGPLTNPAGARRQVIGVYDRALVPVMAQALASLGAERAMVVHADSGMDELGTSGPAVIATVEYGVVSVGRFDPAPLGLAAPAAGDLEARDLRHAAALVRAALDGSNPAAGDIAALNAAAALHVAGAARDIAEGLAMARRAVSSGAAARTLAALAATSRG